MEKIGKDWEKNKHFNESSTHTQFDQRHRHSIEKVDTHTMLLQISNTFTNIFKKTKNHVTTIFTTKTTFTTTTIFTTNTQQLYLQRIQRRERLCLVAVRHPTNRVQFASLVATVKGFKTLPTTGAAADGYLWWRKG